MVDEYAITCHGPEATTRRGAPDMLEVNDRFFVLAATALAPASRWSAAPHLLQLHHHRLRRRAHRPAHDRRQHTHLYLRRAVILRMACIKYDSDGTESRDAGSLACILDH